MGRLDETHRRNVAKVLFDLAKMGRQIILLVTDTDIAFGVYRLLKPGVGTEFEIVHNQENLTSNLKEDLMNPMRESMGRGKQGLYLQY